MSDCFIGQEPANAVVCIIHATCKSLALITKGYELENNLRFLSSTDLILPTNPLDTSTQIFKKKQ